MSTEVNYFFTAFVYEDSKTSNAEMFHASKQDQEWLSSLDVELFRLKPVIFNSLFFF